MAAAAPIRLQDDTDPAVDAVESYVEGTTGAAGEDASTGLTSLLLLLGFAVVLLVVFVVVVRRVGRQRRAG